MPSVRFQPADITVEVAPGTLIHEAAVRAGILDLELPCGGQGSCGQCLVELASDGGRLVMACQTRVTGDIEVRVPENHNVAMRVMGDSHFLVSDELLPDCGSLSPLYQDVRLNVPPASIEQHYSDWTRFVRELAAMSGAATVTTELPVMRELAEAVRDSDGAVTAGVQDFAGSLRVAEIHAGHRTKRALGLAVDIGTTTVAAQIVDLADGRVLATEASYNLQIRRGADIIHRIDYAKTPERLDELRGLVLDTVNGLIAAMTRATASEPDDIRAAFLAGNTTMIHLLLGLPPQHIREAPYVPTATAPPAFESGSIGLNINPRAPVECAPGVGSYLGGDITAGLLCTDLTRNRDQVYLFLDIGTNGEIVVGNADWMIGCACSAGPAFEGSGIKSGMRATHGAIEDVEIAPGAASVRCKVIGGGKPAGICGSGLISILGELFSRGVVDQSGKFLAEPGTGRVVASDNRRAFVVEYAVNTASGEDLLVTEADIENLMRTKAAIYAACALILENVGLDWDAISRVYIAGGFGRYIQVNDAVLIGMLPDLPHGRFSYIGNSALTGAYIALLSREHRRRVHEIAARMTYVDLSSDPKYMDSYIKALFLPHTDMRQFPTAARMLENLRRTSL